MASSDIGGASRLESYKIYVNDQVVATVSAGVLEYTYNAVVAGQSYLVTISAESLIGEGPKSNPLTIWAVSVPTAPTLTLTETTRDSCSVTWTPITPPANSLITGYVVLIDNGVDGPFKIGYDGRQNPSKVFTTIESLTAQTTYRLKVYATNKSGKGAESDIITCYTVTIPGQPGRPELISSTASTI